MCDFVCGVCDFEYGGGLCECEWVFDGGVDGGGVGGVERGEGEDEDVGLVGDERGVV